MCPSIVPTKFENIAWDGVPSECRTTGVSFDDSYNYESGEQMGYISRVGTVDESGNVTWFGHGGYITGWYCCTKADCWTGAWESAVSIGPESDKTGNCIPVWSDGTSGYKPHRYGPGGLVSGDY